MGNNFLRPQISKNILILFTYVIDNLHIYVYIFFSFRLVKALLHSLLDFIVTSDIFEAILILIICM